MERLALLLIGAWLGLLVASSAVAAVNFRTVDRLLGPDLRPELDQRLASVAPADRRVALRHLVSEVNRWIFRAGSLLQLLLAIAVAALLWPSSPLLRGIGLLLLVVSAVQAVGLAGTITSFGRGLDFVPRPLPPQLARRFGVLHGAYVLADLGKTIALVATSVLLLRRP